MQLLIYFSDDYTEADASALRAMIPSLSMSRRWTVSPPRFVDDTDDLSCSAPGDEPIRTVGVVLDIHLRDQRPPTPRDEIRTLVEAMCTFSRDHSVEMEVELGDVFAGTIRLGAADELVEVGLLSTW